MTFRSCNATLIHCAPYRVSQGQKFVLTFKGSKDCVVDMDADAIAELKEALPDVCPCCHRVVEKPSAQANEIEPEKRIRGTEHLYRATLVGEVDSGGREPITCLEFDGQDIDGNLWGVILRMDPYTLERVKGVLT